MAVCERFRGADGRGGGVGERAGGVGSGVLGSGGRVGRFCGVEVCRRGGLEWEWEWEFGGGFWAVEMIGFGVVVA